MAAEVSIKEFEKRVTGQRYTSGAAAKKAIGKFHGWDDKTKNKARAIVYRHFGADPAPKSPRSAKTTAKTAATKTPKKVAPKRTRKPRAPKSVKQELEQMPVAMVATAPHIEITRRGQATQAIRMANEVVQSAMAMRDAEPGIAIDAQLYQAAELQTRALEILVEELGPSTVDLEKLDIPVTASGVASKGEVKKAEPKSGQAKDNGGNGSAKVSLDKATEVGRPPFKSRVAEEMKI